MALLKEKLSDWFLAILGNVDNAQSSLWVDVGCILRVWNMLCKFFGRKDRD